MEKTNIEEFLKKENKIAVVGATPNKEKYGYKVFAQLLKEGYKAFPVNPNYNEIVGRKTFPSLTELSKLIDIDVVIIIVNPKIAKKVVEEAKSLGIRKIWFQPGSEDKEVIELCKKLGLECIYGICYIRDGLKIDFSL